MEIARSGLFGFMGWCGWFEYNDSFVLPKIVKLAMLARLKPRAAFNSINLNIARGTAVSNYGLRKFHE